MGAAIPLQDYQLQMPLGTLDIGLGPFSLQHLREGKGLGKRSCPATKWKHGAPGEGVWICGVDRSSTHQLHRFPLTKTHNAIVIFSCKVSLLQLAAFG